jgi:hypothetical protein
MMTFRFWFESIIGFICLICILLLGAKGASSLLLFVLCPLFMRLMKIRKPDERERQLFYKTSNLTMGLAIIAIIIIHYLKDTEVNGHLIGANWLPLAITSIVFSHGLAGLIIFNTE